MSLMWMPPADHDAALADRAQRGRTSAPTGAKRIARLELSRAGAGVRVAPATAAPDADAARKP